MIQAKPVIPEQYWILRDGDRKVGNIEAEAGGYIVNLNGETVKVKTLTTLTKRVSIDFQTIPRSEPETTRNQVHGFPTDEHPHNAIFDVKHQLPLWTREPRSKSWYTAGWYKVKQHRNWIVMHCPKLIVLERYKYLGPFQTKEEAEA